ncbi:MULTISPECIES: TetR/AcrR family transcriptional regulator [unclassified Paenibacillus]|uniref:TetR/AcrR family transcriptional regulator n=1 Tax=unclassified Paenibacillus TaxID=185978 RepID=UPI0009546647|nr:MULTISPECIES: TetR/AcrR family transcriptional regulator [unclassified Paenibacillus]ASS69010.1 TetR/AcrR family transcriptional regulator [Paenibacillus sp. RUD330]SIR10716.1 transcriptional regulator, TetR family [Paenibacillus sp. RU4X]SIR25945.1 transcriptional regulator, TetR family [Paenibacillus sp. RU4T]
MILIPAHLFQEFQLPHSPKQTEKQKRIADAAIRLFAEKGYSNTSTAEIAKTANVSEASIFKHYGTKDKFLLSLIIPYFKEIFPSTADETLNRMVSSSDSFEDFLFSMLKNRSQFIAENKEIFLVLIKELVYKEELKNEFVSYFSSCVTPRLIKAIELFKERDELVPVPAEQIVRMLFTFVGGFLISRYALLNVEFIPDDELKDAVRFVMDGIRQN